MKTKVDSLELLVDLYEDHMLKYNLPSEEQDKSELTTEQVRWIEAFETLWDLAT